MMRLGVAIITMSLMLVSMAGVAAAGEGPEVTVDCDAELATLAFDLPEDHYVVIVDGDGVETRVDGPFEGTVELETATYRWTEYGIDDSGEARFKDDGEQKPSDCPDSDTTSTTAPEVCEDTTTTKPKKDRDDKPCETTTTTTEATTTTTEATTTTTTQATTTTTTQATTTTTTTTPSTTESEATTTTPLTRAPENQAATIESELTTTTVGAEVESAGETSTTVAPVTSPDTLPFTGPAAMAGLGVAGSASVLFGMVALAAARSQRRR